MNYYVFKDISSLKKKIYERVEDSKKEIENNRFREILIIEILENDNDIGKKGTVELILDIINENEDLEVNEYYQPFILFLSKKELELSKFNCDKTFHYNLTISDILELISKHIKINNENETKKDVVIESETEILSQQVIVEEFFIFFRQINVVFSYYNELGDEFFFPISDKNIKREKIILEEEINYPLFFNILVIGQTGAGKSTLINTLLQQKKTIEGGTGLSTTSKNIIILRAKKYPIRFYDVRGIEDPKSINKISKILKTLDANMKFSLDCINAIFYCIDFGYGCGTLIHIQEKKIIEIIKKYKTKIIFIITKTGKDPSKNDLENEENKKYWESEENKKEWKNKFNKVKNAIMNKFNDKEIRQYIEFVFVNLKSDVAISKEKFGVDKICKIFTDKKIKAKLEKINLNYFDGKDMGKLRSKRN